MRRALWLLIVMLVGTAMPTSAQTYAGNRITIGASPTMPDGSTVRITGLGSSGGTGVIFTDAEGDMIKRALAKADLPATVVFTDQANTFGAFTQTFGGAIAGTSATFSSTLGVTGLSTLTGGFNAGAASSVTGTFSVSGLSTLTGGFTAGAASTVNANLTIGGASDLIVGTGGIRAGSGDVLIRNTGDTGTSAAIGDSAIALNRNTSVTGTLGVSGATTLSTSATVGTTLGVTGLSTLTGGFNAGAASAVNATFNVTGLTTLADVQATGYRGVANPFTVEATDGVTAILRAYDAGRMWIGNTGTDAYWEYNATGNPSGQRNWRVGLVGGNFRVDAGNDAASSWSNLFRSTMSSGVPNGIYWGTGVREVSPDQDFQTNLGNYTAQYANLWVRNLWSTTLVAQDLISTIGGAVLVGPTTTLEADITSGSTSILTAHNEMTTGDVVYLNANLATEFMQVTSTPIAASSSVSFIGENQAVGTTVTLPSHQNGDLIVIFAFRNATTAPTLPAGWNNITDCSASGNSTSVRVGYKIATGSAETSGTWTNATSLMAHVYRSTTGLASAPGACQISSAAGSTSMTYPALTLSKTDHSSWVARAAMASAGTNIQTAPSGYTLRSNNTAVPETASFDSNGRITATSVAASAALAISSANWRTVTLEIVGIGLGPYTYTVTRGYGGVFAARAWESGNALFNTGTTGDGHINMYAIQSIKGSGEQGPTIAGNVRTSTTYNGWSTRWALGNLRNLYNYGATDVYGAAFGNVSDVWLGVDTVGGVRFWDAGTTQTAQFALDGSILLGQTGAGQANTYLTPTSWLLRRGTVNAVSLSSTGLEMFDDASNRRIFVDRVNGSVLLGLTGAGQLNTFVDNTSVILRSGTSNRVMATAGGAYLYDDSGNIRVQATSSGLLLGLTTAGHGNIYADTSGNLHMRSGTVNRVTLEASNAKVRFNDTGGNTRLYIDSTDGLVAGTTAAGQGNIWLDTSGNLRLRSGTVTRMQLTGSNGTFQIFDDDGTTPRVYIDTATAYFGATTGSRVQVDYGSAVRMYNAANKQFFQIDEGNGLLLGDWYTADKSFLQLWPDGSQIAFCRNGGSSCPLIFDGTTGNITSYGNISLGAGGNVQSSGNFVLGDATYGLAIQRSTSSDLLTDKRTIAFLNGSTLVGEIGSLANNGLFIRGGTGANAGVRLSATNYADSYTTYDHGLAITWEETATGGVLNMVAQAMVGWQAFTKDDVTIQFVPVMNSIAPGVELSQIGNASFPWNRVYADQYYAGTTAGFTGTKVAGACTFTISGGVITNVTGC